MPNSVSAQLTSGPQITDPFILAAKSGSVSRVTEALRRGQNVNVFDTTTALIAAVENRHLEIVKILLSAKADVNLRDHLGRSALAVAAYPDGLALMNLLISAGAAPDLPDRWGSTPLMTAAQNGYFDVLAILLNNRAQVNLANNVEMSALMYAADGRHASEEIRLNIVKLLVKHGANVNARSAAAYTDVRRDKSGNLEINYFFHQRADQRIGGSDEYYTPLMIAAQRGNSAIVNFLIQSGAQVNVHCENGYTPLMLAALGGHMDIVKMLLAAGANHLYLNENLETAGDLAPSPEMKLLIQGAENRSIPIIAAAESGDLRQLKSILDREPRMDALSVNGETALGIASRKGYAEIAEYLIAKGSAVNQADNNRYTPLMKAARKGHFAIIEMLLKSKAAVNAANKYHETALLLAVKSGHADIARLLIKSGADLNLGDSYRRSPLHWSLINSHAGIARMLIENGADVFTADAGRSTTLMFCKDYELCALLLKRDVPVNALDVFHRSALFYTDDGPITRLLAEHKADLNIRDNSGGQSALHFAAGDNLTEKVKALIQAGADVNIHAPNYGNQTPLHYLSEYNDNVTIAKDLVNSGARVDSVTYYAETPLHIAANNGRIEIAKFLLQSGADVNAKSDFGTTPLMNAKTPAMARLLIQHKAGLNSEDKFGHSPLSEAQNIEIARILIDNGAQIDRVSQFQYTPLMLACKHGNLPMVRFLISAGADLKSEYGKRAYALALARGDQALVGLFKAAGFGADDDLLQGIENNDFALVQSAIKNGASVNAPDRWGVTPLMLAISKNNKEIFLLLLENHADVNQRSATGETALFWVTSDLEFAKILLEHGADINARDNDDRSLMLNVATSGRTAYYEFLKQRGAKSSSD